MKVGVVGAGSWGTTLARYLHALGHEVSLWVFEEELLRIMLEERVNTFYLPGVRISEAIHITNSLEEIAARAECLLLVTPSHALRGVVEGLKEFVEPRHVFVSATKGIENDSLLTMSQVVRSVLGEVPFAALSGPSFSKEVLAGSPTAVTIASEDMELATRLQLSFSSDTLRIYAHDDVIGTELGGSAKNVMAIAVGISDGLGFGMNARAALMTRGLAEIMRLGVRMGANSMTFTGLSGLGDLILTCTGDLSRNRTVGLRVGRGEKLDAVTASMKQVAEGVRTTKSLYGLAQRHGIDMPITRQVYMVLYEGKDPGSAVTELMGRPLKREIPSEQAHS